MRALNCKAELEALGGGEHTARYILHKRQQLHDEAAKREAQAAATASPATAAALPPAPATSGAIAAAATTTEVPRAAVKSELAQVPANVCTRESGLCSSEADPFDSDIAVVDGNAGPSVNVARSTSLFGSMRVEAKSNTPAEAEQEDDSSQWFD